MTSRSQQKPPYARHMIMHATVHERSACLQDAWPKRCDTRRADGGRVYESPEHSHPNRRACPPDLRQIYHGATRCSGIAGMQACPSPLYPLPTVEKLCDHSALIVEGGGCDTRSSSAVYYDGPRTVRHAETQNFVR